MESDVVEFQHDLLLAVDTLTSAVKTKHLLPPFSATATLMGDHVIKTFDGAFIEFPGATGCSYLLTSDFLHNRFSVMANYGVDKKRSSLSIISDNKEIEIHTR